MRLTLNEEMNLYSTCPVSLDSEIEFHDELRKEYTCEEDKENDNTITNKPKSKQSILQTLERKSESISTKI